MNRHVHEWHERGKRPCGADGQLHRWCNWASGMPTEDGYFVQIDLCVACGAVAMTHERRARRIALRRERGRTPPLDKVEGLDVEASNDAEHGSNAIRFTPSDSE